jgi:hypothetical protein
MHELSCVYKCPLVTWGIREDMLSGNCIWFENISHLNVIAVNSVYLEFLDLN